MADDYQHKYADTEAARMLAGALKRLQVERNLSLRKLAPMLGYKQSTVLSHMANGRILIPIGKAPKIAELLGLPQSEFLIAVMDQRQPEGRTLLSATPDAFFDQPNSFVAELEDIAGVPLEELTTEQKDIMRRLVVDANPARRWLSEAEIPVLQLLRRLRPDIERNGLSGLDRSHIIGALSMEGTSAKRQ